MGTQGYYVGGYGQDYLPNDGQVKANEGNGVKPRWDNTTPTINGVWVPVVYQSPLSFSAFPTTSWPANNPAPVETDFYTVSNGSYIENKIPGQVQTWRLQFSFVKSSTSTGLRIKLFNPLSGFILSNFISFTASFNSGNFSTLFITIADGASLPPPFGTGQGYKIELMADSNAFDNAAGRFLQLESLTRISAQYGGH